MLSGVVLAVGTVQAHLKGGKGWDTCAISVGVYVAAGLGYIGNRKVGISPITLRPAIKVNTPSPVLFVRREGALTHSGHTLLHTRGTIPRIFHVIPEAVSTIKP